MVKLYNIKDFGGSISATAMTIEMFPETFSFAVDTNTNEIIHCLRDVDILVRLLANQLLDLHEKYGYNVPSEYTVEGLTEDNYGYF
jgi:hypothetical protein